MIPIDYRFVNGISGDPATFCEILNSRDAFLFDLGQVDALSAKDLLKVRQVFVSHTHIDHFIGFDRLLRVNIPHGREIFLAGPAGFAENVRCRLKSYTWNLLDEGQLKFVVAEVGCDGDVSHYKISSDSDFALEFIKSATNGLVWEDSSGKKVTACSLDHLVPCISYKVSLPRPDRLDLSEVSKLGWEPGPWVGKLQRAVVLGQETITIEGVDYKVPELSRKIFRAQHDYSLGYLTDVIFSRENIDKIAETFAGVDRIICDASFRRADSVRAKERYHLTTYQAALLAAKVGGHLDVFHVSNIYGQTKEDSVVEAQSFYTEIASKSEIEIDALIATELSQ